MEMIKGIAGCGGYACGVLRQIVRAPAARPEAAGTPEMEWEKAEAARRAAAAWMRDQSEQRRAQGRTEEADILDVHRAMLTDPDFSDGIRAAVMEGASAGAGVRGAAEQLAGMLRGSGSACLRERAADVMDAAAALIRFLDGSGGQEREAEEDQILFCRELLPSDVLGAGERVKGFVAAEGSRTAHACILARARGIPTLVGVGEGADRLAPGETAILDGENQCLLICPAQAALEKFRALAAREEAARLRLERFRGRPTLSADGHSLKLYCNIASAAEAKLALGAGAEGVGLFRSEFLFFGRADLPGEEEQAAAYSAVLRLMAGREVIVRTLDIGADKPVPGVALEREDNPALGCRGIRLCFARPGLFRVQLRALARASAAGNLKVMLPMVCSCEEVRRARAMLEEERAGLAAQGVPVAERIPLGVMIETPAAALISEELARCADFFSIGTNDLTQYTLAVDRGNPAVAELYRTASEPVMALIRRAAASALRAGIPVGVCGESAADPALTLAYLRMGVTELSLSAGDILPMRCRIAGLRLDGAAEKEAEQ